MSVATQITRIKNAVSDAYDSCEEKGATIPATKNVANLASCIDSISGGGNVGYSLTLTGARDKDCDTIFHVKFADGTIWNPYEPFITSGANGIYMSEDGLNLIGVPPQGILPSVIQVMSTSNHLPKLNGTELLYGVWTDLTQDSTFTYYGEYW